jgi:hypothetical protein
MQPEVTTTLHAPAYLDQVNLLEVIARSLPISARIYVKDHPVMVGCRPRTYYRRLARLPNVRIIDPRASSQGLIRDALLTITITGTAAWEAAAMGKSAVLMAPTLFDRCRGIARFDGDLSSLPTFLAAALDGIGLEGDYGPEDFLIALWRKSFAADGLGYARTAAEVMLDEVETYAAAVERFVSERRPPTATPASAVTSAETSP